MHARPYSSSEKVTTSAVLSLCPPLHPRIVRYPWHRLLSSVTNESGTSSLSATSTKLARQLHHNAKHILYRVNLPERFETPYSTLTDHFKSNTASLVHILLTLLSLQVSHSTPCNTQQVLRRHRWEATTSHLLYQRQYLDHLSAASTVAFPVYEVSRRIETCLAMFSFLSLDSYQLASVSHPHSSLHDAIILLKFDSKSRALSSTSSRQSSLETYWTRPEAA
ncbi:hypothetical protein HBH53_039300 [Parastagonospora nodorum]|nr:hypothetical protein HBH53_039300 [Parastagonospora nodorum]KAH4848958.1 hypothetical protein HBH75_149650 [Parastagonospora nodorum]KAH5181916.1 hypothetical protein HBH76_157390 [Parastagonospora nodorum]KAH5213961.1 hypothetical protein HBH68_061800 [Parastagonospora nodorum]KAH5365017.1 hypothetical protein HBI49_109870 [Parastagonospora nodorum]